MLAALSGIPYKNNEITLNPGDKLFIYTDGVTEATDKNNTLYGEERLLSALQKDEAKMLNPEELLKFVKNDVEKFVDGADQFDDITMLGMIFKRNRMEGK